MRRIAATALLAAGLALAACEPGAAAGEAATTATVAPQVSTIDAAQLTQMLEQGEVRLIDVRTDEEVAGGMIPGAEHVALDDFDPATLGIEDTSDVVLYCRSGRRSGIAAERLADYTGQNVKHLEGGITAWQASGGETVPPAGN